MFNSIRRLSQPASCRMLPKTTQYYLASEKLYNINLLISHFPSVYSGNPDLNNYVEDVVGLVLKTNKNYIIVNDPYIMKNVTTNYTKLLEEPSIPKKHMKYIHISYRILHFVCNENNYK